MKWFFILIITPTNGVYNSFDYDHNGRLTSLDYNNQNDVLKTYAITYDGAGNITELNNNSYQYDALNQLVFADLQGKFENNPDEDIQSVYGTISDLPDRML